MVLGASGADIGQSYGTKVVGQMYIDLAIPIPPTFVQNSTSVDGSPQDSPPHEYEK